MANTEQWDEEFEQRLTGFLKEHLAELLTNEGLSRPAMVYEIELRERLVRLEEAIKHQGDLIQKTLDFMDVRFKAVDKRFEAVDKRFENLRADMNKRFEAVDRRFEAVDRRFNALQWLIGGGFTFLTVVVVLLKFLIGP
ncbi:MAG: hypothetical protein KJ573_08430 [Proteobacteria bacterium]|nr:hypothetical protein [Pseudomonadota bacterium]